MDDKTVGAVARALCRTDVCDDNKFWQKYKHQVEAAITAYESALSDTPEIDIHRTRWQRLVNAIADKFNRGTVVGNDDEAVENAITLVRHGDQLG